MVGKIGYVETRFDKKSDKLFDEIIESVGLKKDFKDDFHCTISYSVKPFNFKLSGTDDDSITEVKIHEKAIIKSFNNFKTGDGLNLHVVLDAPFCKSEFTRAIKAGAVFDYPKYIAHVTLMYNCEKDGNPIKVESLTNQLKKYIGRTIIMNKELKSKLNTNWVSESKK